MKLQLKRSGVCEVKEEEARYNALCDLVAPAVPTVVFETYWRFAVERQNIFFRRMTKETPPWTEDPILSQFKFTNAYRASDRVSQFLIKHVLYDGEQTEEEIFFRTMLFKLFNKIETWSLLQGSIETIMWSDYSFEKYDKILTRAIESGSTIYSAAYIMPSGSSSFGDTKKHRNHLHLIEFMMKNGLPRKIAKAKSLKEVFELLVACPTIGDFLAFQYAIDLNYSNLIDFSEMDFVVAGPGARDGIRKCFSSTGGLTNEELIRFICERQSKIFEILGLEFRDLFGRPLQLIDCQNLFCEVDKYARVKHPDVIGLTGRTKIKQSFRPTFAMIEYYFPPKWNLCVTQPSRKNGAKQLMLNLAATN